MTLGGTPSQTVGPFFAIGLLREPQNELVRGGSIRIVGRVVDGLGDPVPDALVELWQPGDGGTRWGRCGTDQAGEFSFVTEKPPAADGEAPAIEVMVFARGLLRHVATRMYFPDEAEANAADRLLTALEPGERETLVARDEGAGLRFDVVLQGERQTVFFAV
jgi:protocatechuate 3,4-dioxygenase, alpha subunit